MNLVSEVITQDQIQDLWGCGFTIVARRRHPDPFYVPQDMVPQGRSYQWWHLVHDKTHFEMRGSNPSGWAPVPSSRHDGYFMPFGHVGDIEVNGLGLFEKSKFEVDQDRAQNITAAHKLVDDWKEKFGGELSGEFKVGNDVATLGDAKVTSILLSDPSMDVAECQEGRIIKATVAIPKDMLPHMSAVFAERDRLRDGVVNENNPNGIILKPGEIADKFKAAIDADDSRPRWSILHAILLPIAIENVRKSLKQESTS